jgi:hypothetical protein
MFSSKTLQVTWAYDLKEIIQKNFSNRQWAKLTQYVVDQQILTLIDNGVSPVARNRKLKPYSESYKAVIKGQMKFFTNKETGGVFFIKPEGKVRKDRATGALFTPLTKEGKVQRQSFEKGLGVGKAISPPNLTVTGTMLSHYDARPGENTFEITLGIHKDAPELERLKAKANNEGTDKIPARRFVPLAGESYTRKITLEIKKLFAYCLEQAINRSKNR